MLKQGRHVVGRNDVAPAARGGQASVAVAGGQVKHFPAGPQIESLAKFLADNLKCRADDGVIA